MISEFGYLRDYDYSIALERYCFLDGCLSLFFFLAGLFIQFLYPASDPAIWGFTFFSSHYSYPNLWSLGICWVLVAVGQLALFGHFYHNGKWKFNAWIVILLCGFR